MRLFLCLFVFLTLKPITNHATPSSNMIPFHPLHSPIQYEIHLNNTSNPGYQKFANLVGTAYAFDALEQANRFALQTLSVVRFLIPDIYFSQPFGNGKGYTRVILSLESFGEEEVGYPDQVSSTKGNEIRLNFDYMNDYVGDLRTEFTGILYHESTRVWQWTGNGTAPDWLISGIADYVRLKAWFPSEKWASRGSGRHWDEGYAVAAYFLEYCNGMKPWFVRELNGKMKDNYSDSYFKDLLGKSVLELWNDYKSVYQPLWYEVIDNGSNQGNLRFKREVGMQYAARTLRLASEFALKVLNSNVRQDKPYKQVKLILESFAVATFPEMYYMTVASTTGSTIRLNSDYIMNFIGDMKAEFTGVLYHESTRVWQWTGNGAAPRGLVNGIADYVRLKAGWKSRTWPERGSGEIWSEGYAVTAYFLEYCEGLRNGFVAQLNTMMKDTYSPSFFTRILGKDVFQLWKDYKTAYAAQAPSPAAAAPMAPSWAAASPKAPSPAAGAPKAPSPTTAAAP